mmetsp:Transcript_25267/g.41473  ORF Transcript_25267/g.41473 Transcript_25267/m.41473 type:complete len:86 (+) Transcript_25267:962-1219(+)
MLLPIMKHHGIATHKRLKVSTDKPSLSSKEIINKQDACKSEPRQMGKRNWGCAARKTAWFLLIMIQIADAKHINAVIEKSVSPKI